MKANIQNIGKNIVGNNYYRMLTAYVIFLAILISPLLTFSQTAPVLEPLGGFAIDGDLQSNTPVLDVGDWVMGPAGAGEHVLHNDGTALDSLNSGLFLDNYNGNDIIFQGSKFNQNPNLWSWSVGKANSKNDINNVMYHLAKDAGDNMWIMLGSDRYTTSGTSYIDFEFLQNTLVRTSDFGFSSTGPHGGRTINDMIVSVEYSNGGSAGNIRIYLWKPVGTGYDYVEQTIPAGVAFASTNSSIVSVPFGAFGTTSYIPYQFAEAAVNISDLFGALDPCLGLSVKTIIVKTKASTSLTANLGDFAEPIQVSLSLGTAEVSYNNNMDLCPTGTVSPVINGVEDGTFSVNPTGLSLNASTGEIDLDNSLPGDYTITYSFVTNGCPRTVDTDITILESPEAPVSASSDLSLLCADHSGTITLSTTGGSGEILNWYSGSCSGTLIGTGNNLEIPAPLSTTTYYAAWQNECETSACSDVTVTVLPEIIVSPSITAEISAFNATDGEITVSVSGGTGNYTYAINGGTPQTSNVFSNLSSGNYVIEVIDDHGCVGTESIIINNALEIIATDDIISGINGYIGATDVINVFDNDSLNGNPVNPADVTLTETIADPTATLTLNSDGSVDVAPGTAAGTYELTYQICEVANPTNCDDAIVSITVVPAEIIANDDSASGINGYTGQIGILNVFANDLLNGTAVDPLEVVLSETITDPSGNLTLNPDGSVDLAAGTPAGTYTLTYQICEILNPTNCDDAIVTVNISATQIIANDDSAAGIDGTAGAINILNVFDNDLLNGDPVIPAEVILSTVNPNANIILNPDGSVDVPPFTPGGTYTMTYEICELLNPTNCDQAIVTIEVIKTSDVSIVKSHIDPSNLPVGSPASLIEISPSVITAGTKIYYFLQVDNFGPDRSVNALITDMLPANITNPEFSLNFGNSWFSWGGTRMLTDFDYPGVNHILIRGDVDPNAVGTLTNTATIYSADTFDPDLTNNESTVVTTIVQSADLNITKQALTSPVVIGGQIVYQLSVTNYGPSAASNVIITDIIDPTVISGVEYSIDGGGTWLSPWTGSINIGTLADGASSSIRIRGIVIDMSPMPNTDPIPNTASVTSDVPDPDPTNNEETIFTPLNDEADISIVKTGPVSVVAGETIEYTINIANNSNTFDALGVHVQDIIDLSIIENPEFSIDGGTIWNPWATEYEIGTMTPLSTFQLLIRGTVISSVTTDIPNTAVVDSDTPDSDQTNNTSTIFTPLEIVSDLEVIKIQIDPAIIPIDSTQLFSDPYALMIDPLEITAGDSIYYVLVYTNYGPSDVTNSEITDLLPAGISSFDASRCQANYFPWPGSGSANQGTIVAGGRCLIIFRGVVEEDASGSIINTATITNTDGINDPDLTNNTSTVITPIRSQADLGIVKTVNNSNPYVGDDVVFTLTVTNYGPTDADNVLVADLLPNGYTYVSHNTLTGTYDNVTGLWNIANIPFPGTASLNITATVNLPSAGVDYLNIATIIGSDQFDPDPGNDEDDETTNPINVIIANDDNGGPINGYTGVVNILNVFDNDLLNGSPVNPADLLLTETLADPTGNLTLNPDGSVDLAPGTPEGTYTLTYQICEIANPTNCDDAIVTITVEAPEIIANDDIAGGVNGYDGQINVLNVFDNDLLNGMPVDPADVTMTETVPDPTGSLTLNPDGSVAVAPGTSEGTYQLTYEICEITNPTNCDDAIVTISVNAPQIIANDDFASGINGYDGGSAILNVYDNDLLNGNPVIPAEVILTETVADPTGALTLNPDGTVDLAPGTPEGTYTLTYEICEIINPINCDDAIVTVSVSATSIIAIDDTYFSVNGYDGMINVLNVLNNDTLNGSPVIPAEVILTETLAEPNGYIIMNPDGSIDVPAGTPAGIYYLSYEICEVLNPLNCDDATVTVKVNPPQIIAVEDNQTGVNGYTGEINVLNVFNNDLLNGNPVDPAEVSLSETVPEPNGYLVLNPDGSVDVMPGTPAGTHTLIYEICENLNPTNCSDAPVFITITAAAITAVDDNFTASPIDCEIGGIAGNVLDNDLLDAAPADPADVIITLTDDGGIAGASISANGDLNIPAGLAVGSYSLSYQICEAINPTNCDNANIIVVVQDFVDPTITCPADITVNNDVDNCEATGVTITPPTTNDNCGVASVVGVRSDMLGLSDPYPLGITTITWTVTDYSGNFATCEQLVTVIDNQLPTITCPAPVAVNTDADECTASSVVLGTPTVDDNCTVASVTNDAPTTFPIGNTIVTWTVTDGSGNIETCEQIVTVTDGELPTITCQEDINACSSEITLVEPEVSDNCGIAEITNNAPEVFPVGTTTILWTVTDVNGNISTCEQNVFVSQIEATVEASSQVTCTDASDGEITVSMEGAFGDVTYSLNGATPQSSNSFTGLSTGTYTVLIEDENMCSITLTDIIIENPEALSVSFDATDAVTCYGADNGTIEVFVSGGTGDYVVELTNETSGLDYSVSTTPYIFENLSAGDYLVSVTDENGCFETANLTIGTPEALTLSYAAYCDAGIVGVELTASGGNGNYQYSIDAGQTWTQSNRFDNLVNNTSLMLMVTDENNCVSEIIEVPVESLNTLNASAELISGNSCYGVSDAAVQINTEGGVAPYVYTVNGENTYYSNLIDSLSAGDYVINIQDANGCPAITEISIESSDEIIIDVVSTTNADCNGNKNGTAEIEAVGGSGEFEYNWANGSNFEIATDLNAGTHTVTITDTKNCEVTYDVIIESDVVGVELTVNNVFTPNSDGINDFFAISNLELYPDNELVVLNRWGNEVYSRKSYNNLWDGSNLSEGTYFYVLKVKICDEYQTFNGYITILD
ncbi:MAG: gliding motility-associated C-terminal domain-containing protein [Bacteroidales bacterium]|jgi:uncharacterized repeat protein (TIGR01451 family)/gliding motility-associated-like protein|nr:gliding motility-associated C-terminal domain-containing protein [Bacteroidales bacterium]